MTRFFKLLVLSGALYSSVTMAQKSAIEPEMVDISHGSFVMGSNVEGDFKLSSAPLHQVTISAFRMAKYEVTVGEFRTFVDATNYQVRKECWRREKGRKAVGVAPGSWDSPEYAPSEFHPVMCVSSNDAHAYIEWLSKESDTSYRLPSEAEWEYAARAGSTAAYHFGGKTEALCRYGNIFDRSGVRAFERDLGGDWGGVNCDDGAEYTSLVGMYEPNVFGLYDMIGNVGEIVADCEHYNYENAPIDGSAWMISCKEEEYLWGLIVFELKVVHRGGSYGDGALYSRTAIRGHTGISNTSSLGEGFRIAQDIVLGSHERNAPTHTTLIFREKMSFAQNAEQVQRKSRLK